MTGNVFVCFLEKIALSQAGDRYISDEFAKQPWWTIVILKGFELQLLLNHDRPLFVRPFAIVCPQSVHLVVRPVVVVRPLSVPSSVLSLSSLSSVYPSVQPSVPS